MQGVGRTDFRIAAAINFTKKQPMYLCVISIDEFSLFYGEHLLRNAAHLKWKERKIFGMNYCYFFDSKIERCRIYQ